MLKPMFFVGLVFALTSAVLAEERPKATGTVPDGHVIIESALGGKYIIVKSLKEQYDKLRSRVRSLKEQILSRDIDEQLARRELKELHADLQKAVQQINDSKQLVTPARVHIRKETTRFDLGPERFLLIRAGKVRIVGWDKPHVECVLEKIVLSVDGEDVDDHLAGIKLIHRHGTASEEIGRTEEEYVKNRKKGAAELSERQKQFLQDWLQWHAPFRPMQGKEIDIVQIDGLKKGNQQIQIELRGKDSGSLSSQWRRHASLTVYVPACKLVGILGGRKGIDVDSLDGSLAIRGEDNIDYDARSRVANLTGNLTAHHIALHVVENIGGNVSIHRTAFEENSGTNHRGNSRTTYAGSPHPYTYKNVTGDLRVWFGRADLHIENISGVVDVRNDFGDTTFISNQSLRKAAHRFVSESGNIELRLPKNSARDLPTMAMTECGVVNCVNVRQQVLESKNITGTSMPNRVRRSWKGFVSSRNPDDEKIPISGLIRRFNGLIRRIDSALIGEERETGLDIISRSGMIRLDFSE